MHTTAENRISFKFEERKLNNYWDQIPNNYLKIIPNSNQFTSMRIKPENGMLSNACSDLHFSFLFLPVHF
jgi:hypothetical protein